MGTFLSITSVVGKSQQQVAQSLSEYLSSINGGLQAEMLDARHDNCCIIGQHQSNTSIVYPVGFSGWDEAAVFLSGDLQAPVFSFHIHDGDLWMYELFVNGERADRFNPLPDYWDDEISAAAIKSWKGNPAIVCKYVPSVRLQDIKNYLVRWDPDADEPPKAYPGDAFAREDWQLLDFMKKLGLPYPLDDEGHATGATYRLWSPGLPVAGQSKPAGQGGRRPWWKCW